MQTVISDFTLELICTVWIQSRQYIPALELQFFVCDSDLKLEKFPEAEFVAGSIGLGGVVGHFTDKNVCAKLLHLLFHVNNTELS